MIRKTNENRHRKCALSGCTRKAMQDGPYCSVECMREDSK